MKLALSALAAAAGLFGAQAAVAGGYVPSVVDPVPVVAEPVTVAPTWQGAYGGVTLGYAFNGDDRVGLWNGDDLLVEDAGNVEISGVTGGIRAGYRWQRNNLVIGPELSFEGGSVDDSFTFNGVEYESKLKNKATLRLKTGYLVQPNTLAYGIVGYSRGSFEFSEAGDSTSYDANGYVVGVGVERLVTERVSVTGEIEHNGFGAEWVELDSGLRTKASPEHTNVKLGLNFKF